MKRSDITRELGYIDSEFIAEAASYKPRRSGIVRIVALAACIATLLTTAMVWGLASQPEDISTFETLSSVITSEDGAYSLSKFNQKEIFADLSRDNLREIFAAFDIVLEKNESIELKDTMYHRALFDEEKIEYTLTDDINLEYIYLCVENGEEIVLNHNGRMTVYTNQNPDVLKYAMLSSVYMELFPDNWTYGFTQEDVHALNTEWWPSVTVIPDHEEYGFDSAFDAFQSYTGNTEKRFGFRVGISVHPNSTKMYQEINAIMQNSDDSYVLELFFYWYDKYMKLNEEYPMAK